MASLEMKGPYKLSVQNIDRAVSRISPGNYALGYSSDDKFIVKYIGRSDSDVNQRLKQHVDEYSSFKYSYASSPYDAFKKECVNYHDFGEAKKLDNKNHPDRPDGSGWKCPICDIFK
jgi:hypothetical protein